MSLLLTVLASQFIDTLGYVSSNVPEYDSIVNFLYDLKYVPVEIDEQTLWNIKMQAMSEGEFVETFNFRNVIEYVEAPTLDGSIFRTRSDPKDVEIIIFRKPSGEIAKFIIRETYHHSTYSSTYIMLYKPR